MNEQERRAAVERAAIDMAVAGLGWHYDAIERLTRPSIKAVVRAAMSKTEQFYVCPHCGREATHPKVTITHDYEPKEDERAARPDRLGVGDQRLHCPCGHVYTWFSARQVTFKDRT